MKKLCPQCWQKRPLPSFQGKRGKPVNWCTICRGRYRGWDKKTAAEKAAVPRKGVPRTTALRVALYLNSKNRKLGGIPASVTSRGTCPPSCSFFEAGCFAEYHLLAHQWRTVGKSGGTWRAFCDAIAALPAGQLWRHNTAGDLPGQGDTIDSHKLVELVEANASGFGAPRRGFTFTHKPVLGMNTGRGANRMAIGYANSKGFTVNLSADSLAQADQLAKLGIAPVAVVVPHDAPLRLKTPAGRRVTICPAETPAQLTCADCELCAIPDRKTIIGFRAHGQAKALVSELVRSKRAA